MKQSASILKLLFFLAFLSYSFQAMAQFTVTEDFRGAGGPDIIIGDDAYLTSGVDDPVGAGWLRLTEALGDQKGYAFVDKSFPSTLGVIVDFEYTMWRNNENATYYGADGLSIFLFDANYGPGNFSLGAYGGSLGYANSTDSSPATGGVTGGYVGVGLDAYGNFVRASEGKNGGSSNVSPNSIALRGPTTSTNPNDTSTNRYLAGVTILNDDTIEDALDELGNAQNDVIDYNTPTSVRPSSSIFYRRVQLEIIPSTVNTYNIIVRWATKQDGAFTELINYETTDVPPSLLKIGFAASTGGGFNNHEIRNLLITTPGNLRVVKKANKNILRSIDAGNSDNEITYTIEVINDTDAALTGIDFEDKLTDTEGNTIPNSMFDITSISHSGFGPGTSLPTTASSNEFSGSLNMAANSTAQITVTGTLNDIPNGNQLINTSTALPTDITDEDLQNNTSEVKTPVIAEGVDLVVDKIADQSCLDQTNGNDFTVRVYNTGANDLIYSATHEVVVTETLPSGTSISNLDHSGWSHSSNGNEHTFTLNGSGTLASGLALPPISYTLTATSGSGYTNQVAVELVSDSGTSEENTEPSENQNNNTDSVAIVAQPGLPTTSENPIYYCQNETASPLEATSDAGNELIWYLNEGGVPSSSAFTPDTSTPGSISYYVSQTNGSCESELEEIEVIVLENPTAGSISGNQEICSGTVPDEITSTSLGSGGSDTTLTYRWEKSTDNELTWEEVIGATTASYTPDPVTEDTSYRRVSIATNTNGVSCESTATTAVEVNTKLCRIITNPMLPSKAKNN